MKISQLNKLALICNLAFCFALGMRYYPLFQGTSAESLILVSGLVLSPLVNLLVLVINLVQFGSPAFRTIRPLALLNSLFLLLQAFLLFSGALSLGNTNA